MRNILLYTGMVFLLACNNEGSEREIPSDTVIVAEETPASAPDRLLWISDYDTVKNQFYLKQQRTINADTLTAASLINDLNAAWENVKLVFVKTSNDTLYVAIPDSKFLGQQMGSAGAQAYMASTTFSLTELKGIRYVNYDMPSGDHISAGTFSRKDFENYR
ncbi:hypothetical protein [Terrimonas alba]|uniref:hypothetical protein n=1 Tax=Terrimonas alba TaxID=3349636 RepID=UPI0035F29D0D